MEELKSTVSVEPIVHEVIAPHFGAAIGGPDIAFGGRKQSGVGVENSLHGLAEYCDMQTIMEKPLAG